MLATIILLGLALLIQTWRLRSTKRQLKEEVERPKRTAGMIARAKEAARLETLIIVVAAIGFSGCFHDQDPTAPRRNSVNNSTTTIIICPLYFHHLTGRVDTIPCPKR
jgi:hypothetical protein